MFKYFTSLAHTVGTYKTRYHYSCNSVQFYECTHMLSNEAENLFYFVKIEFDGFKFLQKHIIYLNFYSLNFYLWPKMHFTARIDIQFYSNIFSIFKNLVKLKY